MRFRRTKIVATLGPATSSPAMVKRALHAGVDVVRFNFSHGTLDEHASAIRLVRKCAKAIDRPIGILADLPGPKLRTGNLYMGSPVTLQHGAHCILTTRDVLGTEEVIPLLYKNLPRFVRSGDRILLADGLLELRVIRVERKNIHCRVVTGGELGEHKGINLPGRHLPIPAVTERDKEALRFAAKQDVDFVALSFVQRANDIGVARKILASLKHPIPIIAKIEKPEALKHIDSILDASNGIMIARGDLGVEVPSSEVPVVQKNLIHRAFEKAVPVITATQMLDSMIHNPRPTRAETTDVANAIWDGSDAVMLSNETAAGEHPIETIRTMAEIIERAEEHPAFGWRPKEIENSPSDTHAVLQAVKRICSPGVHKAIVTYTKTGSTAIALSKLRPIVPVFALTPDSNTFRRLSLIWGVRALVSPRGRNVDEMIRSGDQVLMKNAGLKMKDRVILVAGTRLTSGATNLMKIHQIGDTLSGKH